MEIAIKKLDIVYCAAMADLLNSDENLHLALTPNRALIKISGIEYFNGCKIWETRKNGKNYIILCDDIPIGSISYHKKNNLVAGCGYWIRSSLWDKGYSTKAFSLFLPLIKEAGFKYVTASILKDNKASLKIWTKYTSNIKEDQFRYTPLIELS